MHAAVSVATMVAAGAASAQEVEEWNAKAQATNVWQTRPAFSSPYEGAHRVTLTAGNLSVIEGGGLTSFLGDGRLNYAPEQILETYYAFAALKGLTLSVDCQRIRNPGYNADRGPTSFFAMRVHVEN